MVVSEEKAGDPIPQYLLKKNGFPWNGDKADITNAVTSECFLLTHRDHGGRVRWTYPCYEWSDVLLWPNFNLLPVVWSINCMTGWFDNETDFQGYTDLTKNNEECFSEYLERPAYSVYGDCGAVSIIASTRVSYSGPNDYLFLGMTDAIWPGYIKKIDPLSNIPLIPVYTMGDVLYYGKLYMLNKCSKDEYRKAVLEGFHLFGDPATEMRTEKPNYIFANIPSVWPFILYPNDFSITVDLMTKDNEYLGPAKGAKVTISKKHVPLSDYRDYYVGKTDEEGVVIFPNFIVSRLGGYNIVVTAPNSVPFEGTFVVQTDQ